MISSQLTLKQLEAFACVVDTGSFRKAATVLRTTQPNISNRIAALEAHLGVVLMHRGAGAVMLTERGEVLLESARQVLRSAEAFVEAAQRRDLVADRLRLGVTELVACTWLHEFIRTFRAAYPAVAVELQVNMSTDIDKALVAGQLDLTLQSGAFESGSIVALPLGSNPYVWVATPELAAQIGDGSQLAAFWRVPVLAHARDSLASRLLLREAEAQRLPAGNIVFSSSLTSCVPMAVDGMGVALLLEGMIREPVEAGRLVRLDCAWHPPALDFFVRFEAARAPRFVEAAAHCAVATASQTDRWINPIYRP